AINLGVENEYPETSEAYYYKAISLFYQARYDEGIEVTRSGLEWTNTYNQTNADIQGKLHYRMAGNYIMKGLYEVGLDQLLKAQDIFEANNNNDLLFMNLNGIGVVWLKLKEYERALAIYQEMLTFEKQDPILVVPLYYNLAQINFELQKFDDAFNYIQECLTIIPETDGRLSQVYYMLGNIQSGLGNIDEAMIAFESSMDLYKEQNNELNSVQPKLGLARLLINEGNLERAMSVTNESLEIALRYESLPDHTEVMGVLSIISEEQGNLESALRNYKIFHQLSDSLYNATINQEVANKIAEHDYENEKQEILFSQQEQRLRAEAQILRQRIVIIGSIVIIILVFSILIIQRNKAKERLIANEMLIRKNEIIEVEARKLDEANSIKNRLFSIIAHDLRNPLSSLQGVIQLIEMKAASKKELDRILPYLTSKFENTSIMLGNLLEWSMSQMDGYHIIPENFDLTELVKNQFEIVRSRSDEKELSISLPTNSVEVFADKNMIGIVILNLLSNAIKFTGLHGRITIIINDTLDEITISVTDTGKGIPSDKLPYILNDEFKSTQGTKGEKGTGLGLIICKEFIQKNQGKIWIQSEESTGTTVSFSLPVAIQEGKAELKKEEA
ncbi:MAG: tetratricopeptide repeat-containing sensor histidine kinase, partial [Balneolaceae bacterium]